MLEYMSLGDAEIEEWANDLNWFFLTLNKKSSFPEFFAKAAKAPEKSLKELMRELAHAAAERCCR